MKTTVCERGSVVLSTQGRDKGKYYLIIDIKENTLYLADGVKRTAQNPKSKNRKHVKVLGERVDLPADGALDCRIAKFLKDFAKAEEVKSGRI